jgi:hypothetical protein
VLREPVAFFALLRAPRAAGLRLLPRAVAPRRALLRVPAERRLPPRVLAERLRPLAPARRVLARPRALPALRLLLPRPPRFAPRDRPEVFLAMALLSKQ